jgi:chromosomal replication initiator protein
MSTILGMFRWRIFMNPIEIGGAHVQTRACTIGEIQSTVAYFFGMPVEELYQRSTTQAVVVPRQIAMYLAKQITDASLAEIGRQFGGMHYTTVMHSIMRVEEQRKTRDRVELAIRIILEGIKY